MRTKTKNDYPETADIETSSAGYASRFEGPTGEWMLKIQRDIVLDAVASLDIESILDVGGGHGQLAAPLSRAGYRVSVIGSHRDCAKRLQPEIDQGFLEFDVGNLIELPYADNAFDAVMCFRFISHCAAWERLIGELCRVARKHVIIDYPTWQSVNIVSPLLFKLKRMIEKNTRTYTLFSHQQIREAFIQRDFKDTKCSKQFSLPMALHRMLQNPRLSKNLEGACNKVGLTRLIGSPAILVASRT